MNLKEIQQLIKFISTSDLNELEIEKGDFKIHLKKNEKEIVNVQAAPSTNPQQIVANEIVEKTPIGLETKLEQNKEAATENTSHLVEIKSPMIGTFYRSPSPDKPPFIEIGSDISEGSVLCIVEAMKLFNEIESEISGKIVKVLVDDATPVEYDQPLFLVEPK